VSDDGAESREDGQHGDDLYEPPAIHDFGSVREITHGSAQGGNDLSGQQS
jgi:hypothetical protein